MTVKILEPVTTYTKIFNTVEEFNLFYAAHKAEIDSRTTYMLNKMYLVNGYHITKIKGEIMLKKYDPKTDKRYLSKKEQSDRENDALNELRQELDEQAESIREIRESVNKIIKYLTPNSQ